MQNLEVCIIGNMRLEDGGLFSAPKYLQVNCPMLYTKLFIFFLNKFAYLDDHQEIQSPSL